MIRKRICLIIGLLLSLFLLIFSLNFYFLSRLNEQIKQKDATKPKKVTKIEDVHSKIVRNVDQLDDRYRSRNPKFLSVRKQLLKNLRPSSYGNISYVWNSANEDNRKTATEIIVKTLNEKQDVQLLDQLDKHIRRNRKKKSIKWVVDNEIYPAYGRGVGVVCRALQQETIVRAKNSPKGTQLKLMLRLTGGQVAIFKPKWYEKDMVFSGAVYSGKDRHTSEIVAFYLGTILNLRWTPIAVGRKIDLKEVYRRADKELKETMDSLEELQRKDRLGRELTRKISELNGNTMRTIAKL
ncbi:glycosaminoglycan xylosylkinase homolog [Phlebotomus papatasi]|uniref:glycosaminoglycan xylosylkinase homolog n=1 Tax=Phlebotomus papatasi TaxID=29031 RepID=UPI00248349F2|nr:glycosaminoglycan xylosylkinase homolog [Phlebotomus papatasi]